MNFEHHFGGTKLEVDESPFIYLTTNPKFIDVLCVNCYECVGMLDVDKHSLTCSGKTKKAPLRDNSIENLIEKDLRKQF